MRFVAAERRIVLHYLAVMQQDRSMLNLCSVEVFVVSVEGVVFPSASVAMWYCAELSDRNPVIPLILSHPPHLICI